MKLTTFFSAVLLASSVLAVPASLEQRDVIATDLLDSDPYYAENTRKFSGAIKPAPTGKTWKHISARLKVPMPDAPPGSPRGTYQGGGWVGIANRNGSTSLLQAGLTWHVDTSSGSPVRSYTIWTEWFPGGSSMVQGFTAKAGDLVQIDVTATSATTGTVVFTNDRTRQTVRAPVDAPSGYSLQAVEAEWIVEDPTVNGGPAPFARYGKTALAMCRATFAGGATTDASGSTILDMVNDRGVTISHATLVNGSYIAFQSAPK